MALTLTQMNKIRLATFFGWVIGFSVIFALLFVFNSIALATALGPVGWFILGTMVALFMGFLIGNFFGEVYILLTKGNKSPEEGRGKIGKTGQKDISLSPVSSSFIIIGEAGTGKTALLTRFVKGVFIEDYEATVAIDFSRKIIAIDNQNINLRFWDVGGQERFRNFVATYLKLKQGVILTYDITNRQSFDSVSSTYWKELLKNHVPEGVPILLVGMKSDLGEERQVSAEVGGVRAKEIGAVAFYEASAKTGANVETIFHTLAKAALDKSKKAAAAEEKSSLTSPSTSSSSFLPPPPQSPAISPSLTAPGKGSPKKEEDSPTLTQ